MNSSGNSGGEDGVRCEVKRRVEGSGGTGQGHNTRDVRRALVEDDGGCIDGRRSHRLAEEDAQVSINENVKLKISGDSRDDRGWSRVSSCASGETPNLIGHQRVSREVGRGGGHGGGEDSVRREIERWAEGGGDARIRDSPRDVRRALRQGEG